jgi:Outer membrane lipoprotein carrier protein LolA-like
MTFGGRRSALRARALLLIVVSSCPAAAAEGPDPGWDVNRLMQELRQVKTAKGRFVERKHLSILATPLEFSGSLLYVAPDRLEKRTLKPQPETLVLERDVLTIEDRERNRRRTLVLQDYPVVWAFVESIRSTLAGDLPTLARFYAVELDGGEQRWRLTLRPLDPKMQEVVSEIRIGGEGSWVSTFEIVEPGGNRSVMTVTRDADPAPIR